MKSRWFIIFMVVILALGLGTAGMYFALHSANDTTKSEQTTSNSTTSNTTTSNTDLTAPPASTNSVAMQDNMYNPANITVTKGTKVTWTNKDSVNHNVIGLSGPGTLPGSETIAPGQSYSFTFNDKGTVTYHCTFHANMRGVVNVTD